MLSSLTSRLWRLQAGVTRFPSPFVEGYGWDDATGELEFPGATPTDITAQACHDLASMGLRCFMTHCHIHALDAVLCDCNSGGG